MLKIGRLVSQPVSSFIIFSNMWMIIFFLQAEVKEELSAEEMFENKKTKLAELGMELLSNPEASIKTLKEMLDICKDENTNIVKLGLLSLLAVFKDIIPG